ncbi:MAG: hypothetical protein ACI9TY_001315 [Alphaproteobacteria bacterium]|jgi:hypothetical protein
MNLYQIGFISALSLFSYGLEAHAETSTQELGAIAKILSLSKDIPSGDASFAVVYDPASSASMAELNTLKGLMGASYKAPKHNLIIKEVPIDSISSISAPILFMTEGLSASAQQQTLDKGIASKSLTVTTSLNYVESGKCVLGVDVGSGVKIIMNSASFNASKLNFDSAFKFMIKEI